MRVAITGGVAEGKSTVLQTLADLGYSTVSADSVARSVFYDPAVNARLAEIAGVAAPISPPALRAAIIAVPEVRRAVNSVTHPLIYAGIREARAVFAEIPLLIETCMQGEFDEVWVVTCGPREQRRRLLNRYGNPEIVAAMIASQLPSRVKIAFADRVIRTNRRREHVTRIVSEAISRLRLD